MTKIKKTILTSVIAILIVLSSLLLMACGANSTSADAYRLLNTSIATYKANTDLFGEGATYSVQSNFRLADFYSKSQSGAPVTDSENYPAFVTIGLNFIEKYYTQLENLKTKYNFNNLAKQVKEMNKSYDKLVVEFEKFSDLESTANYNIYNGYFARYKQSTKDFINEIYDVAGALGEFLRNEALGDGVKEDVIDLTALNFYMDYNKLLISEDYKNFFINSASGATFDDELFEKVQTQFMAYCTTEFANDSNYLLGATKANEVKELLEAVNADRKNAREALENFSVYEFLTNYQGSITAYEKNNDDANIYYNTIDSYFGNNGILVKLYAYLLLI